ncbi:Ankyrin repeat region domain-containing protein [Forsythia ovata]|uniref:Ankyrin repeat region domain-containing protein n=1 Tax=Forsythia ovata TaxID=205694 RepID=A0ABD1VIR2_9LAMI
MESQLNSKERRLFLKRRQQEIVKELLGRWPELCKICNSSNTSPLYSAAVQGHLDVVNAILDTDVNSIRIVRKNGKTSLHTTARYGLLHIVKALIERDRGIISIKDKQGQTALHMVVVEELLESDHSILNERDKKGNTAAHIATRKSRPQGTYSTVFQARDLESGKIVALKKVRFDNFEPESVCFMAQEIMILRRLDHPNINKVGGINNFPIIM